MEGTKTDCYCQSVISQLEGTFQCSACKRRFHPECLRNPVVTPLAGDTFYDFTCYQCAPDNTEQYSRAKMSWQEALVLTLYNLQLGGGGKRGYFRWKDHTCAFLSTHWNVLFGKHRKKRASWQGTVAGTVSAGCPRYFVSGTAELGEPGWWKLASMKPPVFRVDPPAKAQRRPRQVEGVLLPKTMTDEGPSCKRSRRSKECFSLSAASELKARRSTILDNPGRKRRTMAAMAESLTHNSPLGEQRKRTPAATVTHPPSTSPDVVVGTFLAQTIPGASGVLQLIPDQPGTMATTGSVTTVYHATSTTPQYRMIEPKPERKRSLEQLVAVTREEAATSFGSVTEGSIADDDDGDAMEREERSLPGGGVEREIKEEGSQQGRCLLMNPGDDDSDEDCPELDMSSMAFGPTFNTPFEPCRSPDMVDLVLSMPDSAEAPTPFRTTEDDMVQDAAAENLYGRPPQVYNHSDTAGKCPPQTSRKPDDFALDSEGPSEGEEDEEEEEEEEEEEIDVKHDPCLTVLSARTQSPRHVKRRVQREDRKVAETVEDPSNRLRLMTPYDEKKMLERLEEMMHQQPKSKDGRPLEPWEAKRLCQQRNLLRRKLLVRKAQREHGQPVFDVSAVMARIAEKYGGRKPQNKEEKVKGTEDGRASSSSYHPHSFSCTMLDRFMRRGGKANVDVQHMSFHTRLVGFEDHELRPITSPYTMRVLKPFIWRDRETVPLKVKLMQEIVSYPHRNDPSWTLPRPASIDYCYVRPQHIPSVNALCSAFFWPGIDLSECLQYPDFSCVAMYRRLVVGFAFLVPDVKPNEAYISFLFTRPGWRGAGIATFMIYHLCQTCMGKDITLHVSATNPAMILYQKFGFKAEELCLDFYDKYFPVDSKECKHAFFMRLR